MADETTQQPAQEAPVETAEDASSSEAKARRSRSSAPTTAAPAAAAAPADEAVADVSPAKKFYPVDRLIEDAEGFLGVMSHIAAGALHGIQEAELELADAKQRIDRWLAREVVA